MALTGKRLKVMESLNRQGGFLEEYNIKGEKGVDMVTRNNGFGYICTPKTLQELVILKAVVKRNHKGNIIYVKNNDIDFREIDESILKNKGGIKLTPVQQELVNILKEDKNKYIIYIAVPIKDSGFYIGEENTHKLFKKYQYRTVRKLIEQKVLVSTDGNRTFKLSGV